MNLQNLFRPYYLFRPSQVGVRIARVFMDRTPPRYVRMPWGVTIEIDPRDDMSEAIWHNGIYDIGVSEVLWRLAEPGSLVVDVGANVGFMASLLAARVGPRGRVIAAEPHPLVLEHLRRNVERTEQLAGCAPIEVLGVAVTSTPGEVQLDMPEGFEIHRGRARVVEPGSEGVRTIAVPAVTLDSILAGRSASLVKVDVEGHEPAVFEGGRESLARRAIRHIVYEDHGRAASTVHDRLESHGYRVLSLGVRWNRVITGGRHEELVAANEAPSYLATADVDAARRLLDKPGWQVLRGR